MRGITPGLPTGAAKHRRIRTGGQLALASDLQPFSRAGWTTDDWATPWPLIRELEAEFGAFDIDPCATEASAKAPCWYGKEQDGLTQPWIGKIFLNPPYSAIVPWLEKARDSAATGALVVALIPVRTDRDWWHDIVMPHAEVRFRRGRQRFIGADGTTIGRPVFASAIAVFEKRWESEG